MEVVILFTLVIGLMLIGVPIAISLGMSSVLFLLVFSDSSLASVAQTLFSAFEGHYTLLAIPFFILASSFMTTGGVAQRIIRFSIACVGHLPGGLAIAGVDLLQSDSGPMILEVNSSPGLEGIERATQKDIATAIIRYIERKVALK